MASIRQTILDLLPPAGSGEWTLTADVVRRAVEKLPSLQPRQVWPAVAELACGRLEVKDFGGQQFCRLIPWTTPDVIDPASAEVESAVAARENAELREIAARAMAKQERRAELDAEKIGGDA